MALVNCPNCQMQISEYVHKCPYCGEMIKFEHDTPENHEAKNSSSRVNVISDTSTIVSTFYLKAAGVTHEGRQEVVKRLQVGEPLLFIPDPNNPYDDHAVKIQTVSGADIGFIPKEKNHNIFEALIKHTCTFNVSVSAVTGGGDYAYGVNIKVEELQSKNVIGCRCCGKKIDDSALECAYCGTVVLFKEKNIGLNTPLTFICPICGDVVTGSYCHTCETSISNYYGAKGDEELNWGLSIALGGWEHLSLAVQYFRKAAQLGDSSCINELGYLYREGIGVKKDDREALGLYYLAAKKGCSEAQYNLAVCFEDGVATEQNLKDAEYWYSKAASRGNDGAMYALGCLYYYPHEEFPIDYHKAFNYFKQSAEKGNVEAQLSLGIMCEEGHCPEGSADTAAQWYSKASKAGDARGDYALACCYYNGMGGVKANYGRAVELFRKSARLGYERAVQALKQLGESL